MPRYTPIANCFVCMRWPSRSYTCTSCHTSRTSFGRTAKSKYGRSAVGAERPILIPISSYFYNKHWSACSLIYGDRYFVYRQIYSFPTNWRTPNYYRFSMEHLAYYTPVPGARLPLTDRLLTSLVPVPGVWYRKIRKDNRQMDCEVVAKSNRIVYTSAPCTRFRYVGQIVWCRR